MTDISKQIEELSIQLNELRSRQLKMTNEMIGLERQLAKLKSSILAVSQNDEVHEYLSSVKQDKEPSVGFAYSKTVITNCKKKH